jgi:hypothetical protein
MDRGERSWAVRRIACVLVGLLWPSLLFAQLVSGVLVHPDNTPAGGVQLVSIELATGRVTARTVVSARGTFRLQVPAMPVRLRALRLGYAPVDLLTLSAIPSTSEPLRITLPDAPRPLPALTVVAARRCNVLAESAPELVDAFSAVREALTRVHLDVSDEAPPEAVVVLRDRLLDLNGQPLRPTQHMLRRGASARPFRSLPADSLFMIGFVVQESDGVAYYGPDSDLLLGDAFLQRHCLTFVPAHPERPAWIGISFTAVEARSEIVRVRGVVWIDRATRHLQRLDFTYEGLPAELRALDLGGSVSFDVLPNGAWFESSWTLRMARTFQRLRSGRLGVEALQIVEGDVVAMRGETGTVFQGDARLTQLAAEAARAGVNAWEERGETIGTADPGVCRPDDPSEAALGGVFGVVYSRRPARMPSVTVGVQWRAAQRLVGDEWRWTDEERLTRTDTDGFFVLCGLPIGESVELIAGSGERERRVRFRIADGERVRRLDVELEP